MNLTLSKSENKSAFYRILVFLGILVFIFLIKNLIIPWFIVVGDSYSQYATMSDRLESLSDWKNKNIELKQNINQLKARLEQANVSLTKSSQTSATLNALDSLANNSGVRIKKMEFENITQRGSYKELATILTVEGKYPDISQFVKLIETKNILLNVNSYNVKISSLYSNRITARVNLILLFQK